MRIISGEKRGAKLITLSGDDTRPTTDRVKESLFNIIQFSISGARVLDLFAGSGGLGLECISRGAEHVCFTDVNPEAVKIINSNITKLNFAHRTKVVCGDYLKMLTGTEQYDIIFLDPPYASDYIQKALELIKKNNVLAQDGIVVCETVRDKQLVTDGFNVKKDTAYGITRLVFLEVHSDE